MAHQYSNKQQQSQQQLAGVTSIIVPEASAGYLHDLSKLSPESLKLLAELSKKPGIEAKLKSNAVMLKTFL